jgi:hypothetical protein
MIQLQPTIDLKFPCPVCGNTVEASQWHLTGMHSISSGSCTHCNREYYMEMPTNAGLFYPGIIDAGTGQRADKMPLDNWYLQGLVQAFQKRTRYEVGFSIERLRKVTREKVLILNTIDATYGHALYELFNASYYLKQDDFDLIILLQKNMRWLAPAGAAEIWTVDISFSKANDWNDWLAEKIRQEVSAYKNVYLCRSFVQADSLDYDIEDYSKIKPFPLDEWDARLKKPTVTFIWRTDRFWKRVMPKWIDNRFTRRVIPRTLEKMRNNLQFKWILDFSKYLKSQIPGIDFAIAGMDSRDHPLPGWIKDYRYEKHSDETASEQCERYAASHLVLGCNGSSLVLPGCHAGAVVDIVPGDQWAVSAGTFPFRVTSIGDTHFRYVMLPAEVSIKRLVGIIVSILRDRSYILLQTSPPWREHDGTLDHFAWNDFRLKAFDLNKYFTSTAGMISSPKPKKQVQ